jgi:phosphoribosylformimino-5-aminoimidazole carboxamide ribotide isomerase
MELLAAIDLRDGGAVRLVQGDFDRQSDYGDPHELARRFVAGGAQWLHLVDLDAARTGQPVNRPVIRAIAAEAGAAGVRVQTGGGVRTAEDVEELLGAGVARVVLGTAALEDPALATGCACRHPGAVAVGLDYRRRPDGALEAAARGWLEGSGRTVAELLGELEGAPLGAVVVTAIERDGTLAGPDLAGLAEVLAATGMPVVASGGVGSAGDLKALVDLRSPGSGRGVVGAVVGKALVDGRLSMEEGLAACEPSG